MHHGPTHEHESVGGKQQREYFGRSARFETKRRPDQRDTMAQRHEGREHEGGRDPYVGMRVHGAVSVPLSAKIILKSSGLPGDFTFFCPAMLE